jgi:hypothetical protein
MQGRVMSKLRQMEVFVAVVEAGSFADAVAVVSNGDLRLTALS